MSGGGNGNAGMWGWCCCQGDSEKKEKMTFHSTYHLDLMQTGGCEFRQLPIPPSPTMVPRWPGLGSARHRQGNRVPATDAAVDRDSGMKERLDHVASRRRRTWLQRGIHTCHTPDPINLPEIIHDLPYPPPKNGRHGIHQDEARGSMRPNDLLQHLRPSHQWLRIPQATTAAPSIRP